MKSSSSCAGTAPIVATRLEIGFRFRRVSDRGFSLLEALVAMSIASVSLGSLYRAVGQSAKVATMVESRTEAALVANTVLSSETFADGFIKNNSGQFAGWSWQSHVAQEAAQLRDQLGRSVGEPLRVARVTVSVFNSDGRKAITAASWKPYRSPQ